MTWVDSIPSSTFGVAIAALANNAIAANANSRRLPRVRLLMCSSGLLLTAPIPHTPPTTPRSRSATARPASGNARLSSRPTSFTSHDGGAIAARSVRPPGSTSMPPVYRNTSPRSISAGSRPQRAQRPVVRAAGERPCQPVGVNHVHLVNLRQPPVFALFVLVAQVSFRRQRETAQHGDDQSASQQLPPPRQPCGAQNRRQERAIGQHGQRQQSPRPHPIARATPAPARPSPPPRRTSTPPRPVPSPAYTRRRARPARSAWGSRIRRTGSRARTAADPTR